MHRGLKRAHFGRHGKPFSQGDINTSWSITTVYRPILAHFDHKAMGNFYNCLLHLGGERTSLDLMDLDFQSLHICSLLNAFGQALGAACVLLSPLFYKGECNLSCCSTHQKRSWRRSSLGPHCICPRSTIADHFFGGVTY